MKINIIVLFIVFISISFLSAESISGIIVSQEGPPVPSATVILIESDLILITEENGSFIFEDIENGEYTLLVIAPGFVEFQQLISASPDKLLITLEPEIIEMDTIIVKASDEDPLTIANEGVTSEELELLSTRSDPFDALSQEAGILTEIDIMTGGRGGISAGSGNNDTNSAPGRISMNQSNEISVYGGDSDWNNYYYSYIRIPTNTHTFGYPDPDAVVPVEAVDSIDVYKGAVPVEYGPGIGGVFMMTPKSSSEQFELTITPSIMDISGITSFKLSENINGLFSINQSILNYTVLPIITSFGKIESTSELEEGDTPMSISYGDILLNLSYSPANHYLSLDILGFYDMWNFDLSFNDAFLQSNYNPYFLAGGIQWIYSASANLSNSFYAFGSLYKNTGEFDLYRPDDEKSEVIYYENMWTSSVNSYQFGDEIQWDFTKNKSILFGFNNRFSDLSGDYTDNWLLEDSEGNFLDQSDHNIEFEELLYSAYSYAKFIGKTESLDYQTGTGLLWYPLTGTVRPALDGEIIYSHNLWTFALSTGWSPGVIDEFTYIDRRLDEIYYDLGTETSADQPPMAVSAAGLVNYSFSEKSSINLSPYFSWYYDLSGISMSTSYTDLDDQFISLDPSYGYSSGFDFGWNFSPGDYWNFDISYAFAWTRYYSETGGWVAPNTEVRHALKSSALLNTGNFTAGFNLLAYSGIPFTPEIVVDKGAGPVVIQGEYNSAIDYVPVYEFTTNFSYQWSFKHFKMSLFLNSSNWINGLNFIMTGLDSDLEDKIGSSSEDFDSRNYDFSYTDTDFYLSLLMSEIGLSFSY
ncbi:MAG: TonB-dependent receptor [Spirochaetales bacterium]|nr:TonB-dependent receptor [Spirochaetales bacterium]